ncbi:MAG: LacI family DNA-binding transcriptional regulator, partial [Propionibacteriaceae bacterium]
MAEPVERPARLADVARYAGVSAQTVSRVATGKGGVSGETRSRVEEAIAALRYRPNSVARALATNRTMHIGVIVYDLSVTSPSRALFGVCEEARSFGYSTNLVTVPDVSVSSLRSAIRSLSEDAVEGILVLAPMTGLRAALSELRAGVPLVSFDQGGGNGPDTVGLDEVLAAQVATRHLLSLGHRDIELMAGPDGWAATGAREAGWRREMALASLPIRTPVRARDWSPQAGYDAAREMISRGLPPALLISSDTLAVGAFAAWREAEVRIPDDLSVVSFEASPLAQFMDPPLTSVWLDFAGAGRAALTRLLAVLGVGEPSPPNGSLVPRLVEGKSA